MSLDYDLTAIPADVRETEEGGMAPLTEMLIFSTMMVGIGVIDDDTLDEFVARIELYQKLNGPLLSKAGANGEWEPRPVTREDVEAHKGLKTNVFPMETRTSWVKRIVTRDRTLFPHPEPKKKR